MESLLSLLPRKDFMSFNTTFRHYKKKKKKKNSWLLDFSIFWEPFLFLLCWREHTHLHTSVNNVICISFFPFLSSFSTSCPVPILFLSRLLSNHSEEWAETGALLKELDCALGDASDNEMVGGRKTNFLTHERERGRNTIVGRAGNRDVELLKKDIMPLLVSLCKMELSWRESIVPAPLHFSSIVHWVTVCLCLDNSEAEVDRVWVCLFK